MTIAHCVDIIFGLCILITHHLYKNIIVLLCISADTNNNLSVGLNVIKPKNIDF